MEKQSVVTKERATEITLMFNKIEHNSNLSLDSLLKKFKEQHKKEPILLSDVEFCIEGDESEEQLASDLKISIFELKEFELYLYENTIQ